MAAMKSHSAGQKLTGAGSATLPAGGPFFLSYTKPAALHWRGCGSDRPSPQHGSRAHEKNL